MGYDDNIKIQNINYIREKTGALLIRNSSVSEWGDGGGQNKEWRMIL